MAALMFFGICLLVRALQPKPLETAEGYVAAPAETAVLYDEEGQTIRKLPRGSKVTYVVEEREEGAPVRIVLDEDTFGYLKTENLTDNVEKAVTTGMVYACTVINLTDKSGAQPGALTEKGMALNVLGYDGLQSDGSVVRYRVQTPDGEGYIRADNVSPDEAKAKAQANEKICAIHASRSDKWGGGDAAGLDYATYEKGDFSAQGNTMPDEVKALYLNNESITRADDYIEMAKQCAINAFVVDIVDGGAIAYDSPVMKEYCPSAYKGAYNTAEDYRAAVQKLKDAGYYVIGRITAFNDPNLAEDHPECVIADRSGKPMEIGGMYWPSVYSRFVWQYKVELALEAVKDMGFNEIQFDYTRFPDGTWEYDDDAIDYRNTYGESKAQAVQRFLLYARERLHEAGVYLSADVFGECAEDYVTAYGQYWAAISGVVDAISAMPYPDHYGADGDYLPWEHPYDTLKGFGAMAAKRQKETACPAAVRTWIQAYNAIREPYNTYGPEEVAQEIQALRDTGNTGGYMTWNGASDLDKYYSLMPAFD
ncbi:MAG: hypothetical protein KBS74_02790 [Clostridiales bacterium]|nr:hypothetical protein [Candidatus Cacconaster stercorequi]